MLRALIVAILRVDWAIPDPARMLMNATSPPRPGPGHHGHVGVGEVAASPDGKRVLIEHGLQDEGWLVEIGVDGKNPAIVSQSSLNTLSSDQLFAAWPRFGKKQKRVLGFCP